MLTRTHQVLLPNSNVHRAVPCSPTFWAPQSVALTASPSCMSALALW